MPHSRKRKKLKLTATRSTPAEVDLHIGALRFGRGRGRTSGAVWTTTELLDVPGEGWDEWYEKAYELVPEAGSAVEQIVALVSGCTWVAQKGDDESLKALQEFALRPNIMLGGAMFTGIWNYYTYGRCFIQAHQAKLNDPASVDAVKVPDPRTFKVYRDNEADYQKLKEAVAKAGTTLPAIKDPTAHTGKIIGFMQEVAGTSKPLIFKPEDLIFIPRATPKYPDGISVLHNEYKKCVNIAGAEEMLARAARIYSNPPWYIKVGSPEFPCQPNASGQAMVDFVKGQLGALAEAGEVENITSLVLPNWAEFILPVFNIPIAPVVVEHLYKQLNWLLTGIGIPPAIMSAEGFRATAQEALRFVEDRVHPVRERYQAELTARILLPYLTALHAGKPPGTTWYMPEWSWRDITPGDLDRVRETLVQAHGGPFLSKNEARNIHGGLAPVPNDTWNEPTKGMVETASPEETLTRQQQIERGQGKPIGKVIEDLMGPKEAPKMSHRAAARELGVAIGTLYNWRRECGHWP